MKKVTITSEASNGKWDLHGNCSNCRLQPSNYAVGYGVLSEPINERRCRAASAATRPSFEATAPPSSKYSSTRRTTRVMKRSHNYGAAIERDNPCRLVQTPLCNWPPRLSVGGRRLLIGHDQGSLIPSTLFTLCGAFPT